MAESLKRAPSKPVFVVTHQHPSDTVYGSGKWGNKDIRKMLDPYPSVVSFSGHSHFALQDERSIWQGSFTAVGTSTLHYCELEEGKVNGSVPPEALKCVQMEYVEVYSDHIDIHRFDVLSGREIKPEKIWRIDLPYSPEKAVYTSARAEKRNPPEFAENASAETVVADGEAKLIFTAAKHGDFVHSYEVTVIDPCAEKTAAPVKLLYFSDFYNGLGLMTDKPEFLLPEYAFTAGKEYILEISPLESFGKRGAAIKAHIKIPDGFVFKKKKK